MHEFSVYLRIQGFLLCFLLLQKAIKIRLKNVDWHVMFTAEVHVDILFFFLRLKGENQQLIDYRKKLDELRCWLENAENVLDTRFTFNHEENLRELQARSLSVCMYACICFVQSIRM